MRTTTDTWLWANEGWTADDIAVRDKSETYKSETPPAITVQLGPIAASPTRIFFRSLTDAERFFETVLAKVRAAAGFQGLDTLEENEANARLIAQAPAMREALRVLADGLALDARTADGMTKAEAVAFARDAIIKVEKGQA